jgi:hypothetical protein
MTAVGRTDDAVVFRCHRCGTTYSALRCAGTNARTGNRCAKAVAVGQIACFTHRGVAEAVR